MKILVASDIHSDTRVAQHLAKKAEKEHVDLVILCGDLTLAESSTSGIIGPFVEKKKKVLLIPGNHESLATADFLAEFYNVKNIHGKSTIYYNIGFFGCGSANIGINQLSDEEVFKLLKRGFDAVKGAQKKIMITHVHPAGSLAEKISSFEGSLGVTKAIYSLEPDILVCGHIHEAEGVEEKMHNTTIFNVGRNGKILEI